MSNRMELAGQIKYLVSLLCGEEYIISSPKHNIEPLEGTTIGKPLQIAYFKIKLK